MTYQQYTHNIIIKNQKELFKNSSLIVDNKQKNILQIKENTPTNSPLKTILCPGFINLHSHLAYSELKIKEQNLFPWIKELVSTINQKEAVFSASLNSLAGAKEAISTGTTFLVDNSNHLEASLEAFKTTGLKGIIGMEVFGSDPQKAEEIFTRNLDLLNSLQNKNISITLSPHASYDVSPKLWKLCLNWCKENKLPLLTHLAESDAEEAWFKDKDSAQAQEAKSFWQMIDTLKAKEENWQSYPSSIQYLYCNDMLDSSLILTHMVKASKKDLELIKELEIGIVTCPRSNLYLNNGLPNYQLWQELELNFGCGTDSKASNYDLDLRKELTTINHLSSEEKFSLITNKAAEIIKRDDIGSLDKNKSADFVVFELAKDIDTDVLSNEEIFDLVLDVDLCRVKEVYINGVMCHCEEERSDDAAIQFNSS